jgi:hypothetical protein
MSGLREVGYEPEVIAPRDPAAESRMNALDVDRISGAHQSVGSQPVAALALFRRYRATLSRLPSAAYLGYTIKSNIYGSLAAGSLGIPALRT